MDWYEEESLQRGEYRLILCTYGNCVYWINEQKYIVEKGELLLIPWGCSYYAKSIPTRVHTKQVVGFAWGGQGQVEEGERSKREKHSVRSDEPPDAQHEPLPLLKHRQPLHIKPGSYERIHDMLKQIAVEWQERPAYYEVMMQSQLVQLLVELNREYDRGMISEDRHRLVEQMKRHIQQNYSSRIGKEQLSEVIHRTPNYAATLFKSITGQTISEYVHQERMKRAVYMLTESHLTIAEIAEFLGYPDVSYFYRIFKKKMGVPPTGLMQDRQPLR